MTTTMEDEHIYLVLLTIYLPSFLSKISFSYATNFNNVGFPSVASSNPGRQEYSHLPTTNGIPPIQAISITNPTLAQDITNAISRYSTKPNKHAPSQHDPIELTGGFRLLGLPVGNSQFTTSFLNEQLEAIQNQSKTVHKVIQDPPTMYKHMYKHETLTSISRRRPPQPSRRRNLHR